MATPSDVLAVLAEGRDMTLATLLEDGAPHASTVSYASDGLAVFFGCSSGSQKAQNLARDGRVALTITLPYRDWGQIRGLSASGRARRVAEGDAADRAGLLFMRKFSEIAQYVDTGIGDDLAMFEITLEAAAVLDYRRGFGHVEYIRLLETATA